MGPIVIYYYINSIDEKFNWTHKDCPQTPEVNPRLINQVIQRYYETRRNYLYQQVNTLMILDKIS